MFQPRVPVFPLNGAGLRGSPGGIIPLLGDKVAGFGVSFMTGGSHRPNGKEITINGAVKGIPLLWRGPTGLVGSATTGGIRTGKSQCSKSETQ